MRCMRRVSRGFGDLASSTSRTQIRNFECELYILSVKPTHHTTNLPSVRQGGITLELLITAGTATHPTTTTIFPVLGGGLKPPAAWHGGTGGDIEAGSHDEKQAPLRLTC